jgi:CRP-like cAMP-binding protein
VNIELLDEFRQAVPMLAEQIGTASIHTLLAASELVQLPARHELLREQKEVDALYLILSGELVASISDANGRLELGRIGPGAWVGEVALLSGEMLTSSTVTTLERCRVLKFHWYEVEQLMLHDEVLSSALLGQMIGLLAKRLATSLTAGNAP